MDIFKRICCLLEENQEVALATIIETAGSTPRKAGAKMIIHPDGSHEGTLGGGKLEQEVISAAVRALVDHTCTIIKVDLAAREDSPMACGGWAAVFVEPLSPKPRLVILGAGHVGKALCKAAAFAGFDVVVMDDRPVQTDACGLPDAGRVLNINGFTDPFGDAGINITSRDFIVICTRAHQSDLDALRAALHTPAHFIGLLGSRRKREKFFNILRSEGLLPEQIERIRTPVGLPVGAQTPEEIAISITAQLIEAKAARRK